MEGDKVEQTVYIGTYTDAISRGIYRFAFYKGDLRLLGCIEETNPSYVIVQGDMLYSVRETRDGSIVSYQLQKDGIHTLVGQQKCLGDAPCHLHLDGATCMLQITQADHWRSFLWMSNCE